MEPKNTDTSGLKRPVERGQIMPIRLGPPNKSKAPSLTIRIRAAKTVDEVDKLMTEGDAYKGAALKTRRHWVRVAASRKIDITNPPPAPKENLKKK